MLLMRMLNLYNLIIYNRRSIMCLLKKNVAKRLLMSLGNLIPLKLKNRILK